MISKFIKTMLRLALILGVIISLINITQADQRKNAVELIKSYGFDVETFKIISQNYTLKIYRIVNPLADKNLVFKTPIICHHGINFDQSQMMASARLARPRKPDPNKRITLYRIENGSDDRGLHLYLSNNNYDVWLLEARGVDFLPRVSTDNKKSYWDFSLDEQGLFDLPNQINFILAKTNQTKAAYIGYSQSTSFMFALLSTEPEFANKLVAFIALAPVAFTEHIRGSTNQLTTPIRAKFSTAVPFATWGVMKFLNTFITYICAPDIMKYTLCRHLWKDVAGPDNNANLNNILTEHIMSATSMKVFEQYLRNSIAKDFRMYDYRDEDRNMEEYGQPVPPRYNIDRITLDKIVLFRGDQDFLSDPEDQMKLISKLTVPLYEDHILIDYAHLDFIVSPTVVADVNEPICRVLDKLTNRPLKKIGFSMVDPSDEILPSQEKDFLRNKARYESFAHH